VQRSLFLRGTIYCLLTSIAWGIMFPVMESALQKMNAFYLTFYRYNAMALLLAGILLFAEGRKAFRLEKKLFPLWLYGSMAVAGYNLLVFWAQNRMGQQGTILASIMESMMPMISIPLLWVWKRERPGAFTLGCVAIAFFGVVLIITKGDLSLFRLSGGNLLETGVMFVGVVSWVGYTIGASRFPNWSPLRYSAITCVLGSVTMSVIVLGATALGLLDAPAIDEIVATRWEFGFTTIIAGVIALLCWNAGIRIVRPINGMLFVNFVPVVTFIIAAVQGYKLTPYDIAGTLLIIFSLVASNVYQRISSRKKAAISINHPAG